jgi:hypothetical protein
MCLPNEWVYSSQLGLYSDASSRGAAGGCGHEGVTLELQGLWLLRDLTAKELLPSVVALVIVLLTAPHWEIGELYSGVTTSAWYTS